MKVAGAKSTAEEMMVLVSYQTIIERLFWNKAKARLAGYSFKRNKFSIHCYICILSYGGLF